MRRADPTLPRRQAPLSRSRVILLVPLLVGLLRVPPGPGAVRPEPAARHRPRPGPRAGRLAFVGDKYSPICGRRVLFGRTSTRSRSPTARCGTAVWTTPAHEPAGGCALSSTRSAACGHPRWRSARARLQAGGAGNYGPRVNRCAELRTYPAATSRRQVLWSRRASATANAVDSALHSGRLASHHRRANGAGRGRGAVPQGRPRSSCRSSGGARPDYNPSSRPLPFRPRHRCSAGTAASSPSPSLRRESASEWEGARSHHASPLAEHGDHGEARPSRFATVS